MRLAVIIRRAIARKQCPTPLAGRAGCANFVQCATPQVSHASAPAAARHALGSTRRRVLQHVVGNQFVEIGDIGVALELELYASEA